MDIFSNNGGCSDNLKCVSQETFFTLLCLSIITVMLILLHDYSSSGTHAPTAALTLFMTHLGQKKNNNNADTDLQSYTHTHSRVIRLTAPAPFHKLILNVILCIYCRADFIYLSHLHCWCKLHPVLSLCLSHSLTRWSCENRK